MRDFLWFKKLTLYCGRVIIHGMKKFIAVFMLLCVWPDVGSAFVSRSVAVLRVMNKDAGKVQEISIPVGNGMQFEKLYINMRACMQTDPFDAEDFWGFVEISDGGKGRIFSNWMSRNEPGQNPLQHPDYDIWLVKCE